MAVTIYTGKATILLSKFQTAIESKEKQGQIKTWRIHSHKGETYFTRDDVGNNEGRMFFEAIVKDTQLVFACVSKKGGNTQFDYAYYHGHLIQTFIDHFPNDFTGISASPKSLADAGDRVTIN